MLIQWNGGDRNIKKVKKVYCFVLKISNGQDEFTSWFARHIINDAKFVTGRQCLNRDRPGR